MTNELELAQMIVNFGILDRGESDMHEPEEQDQEASDLYREIDWFVKNKPLNEGFAAKVRALVDAWGTEAYDDSYTEWFENYVEENEE